ncbi:MAG: hypothetical protein PHR06_16405, partial [Candidatus Cloacimonetes bacterium]|nr:hypothetical protein [Candidatus Cloacimonadota bacterium]
TLFRSQNETIGADINAIGLSAGTEIKIYGDTFDTSVTDFCAKYVFYKAYKGTSEISLPQSNMPKVDLGTSSEPIHIVFVPNENQS